MTNNDFFFDDDLEALERARLRGNPLLDQGFQPTPLEVILDGIGRQQTQAPRQNQARDRLQVVQAAAPLDGPVTLRLNGQVLDENVITSARELDSLLNNPSIPQLVQDQIMVASQDGDVRVLSGQGQGPNAAEGSAPQAVLPSGPAPSPIRNAVLPAAPPIPSTNAELAADGRNLRQRNTFPLLRVDDVGKTLERLPMLGPEERGGLFRPPMNLRRGTLNTAKDLTELKIEPPVRQSIEDTRRVFWRSSRARFRRYRETGTSFCARSRENRNKGI